MRQAIVSVSEEEADLFGMERLFSLLREAGVSDVEFLSCEGTRGVARVRVSSMPDEAGLDSLESVEWWERVAGPAEHTYLVGFDAPDPPDGVDVCPDAALPTERVGVDDGEIMFDVTAPADELPDILAAHEAAGMAPSLERLRRYRGEEKTLDALTDRQREVLRTAHDLGYFDVPRAASTEAVAAALDLDDSTVAEHLQRAERNLVETVIGEPL